MRFDLSPLRALAMIGLFLAVAACDDPIAPPPAPTLAATPTHMQLEVGASQMIVATITDLENDSVVFESFNTAIATVDANGLVTGVAPGPVSIQVTAAALPTLKTAVSVIVLAQDDPPVLPPTDTAAVIIQSITRNGSTTHVNPSSVDGLVDLTLSVKRGDATALRVFLGDSEVPTCRQTFGVSGDLMDGALTAEDLSYASTTGNLVCSINTAAYTVVGGIGAPLYPNGEYAFRAELVKGDEILDSAILGAHFLKNTDFVEARISGTDEATHAVTGLLWHGGDVIVNAIPVSYNGHKVTNVTFSYTTPAAYGSVAVSKVVPASPTGFRGVFPAADLPANGGIAGVTDPDFKASTAVVYTNGQVGPVSVSSDWLPTGITAFRVDTEAPNPGVLTGPAVAWINASYLFGSAHGAATGDPGTAPSDDATVVDGIGGITVTYHAAPAAGYANPSALSATERAALVESKGAVLSGEQLPATDTNNDYVVVARVRDALGNQSTTQLQIAGSAENLVPNTIGIDKAAPTLQILTGSPASMAINPMSPYSFEITDDRSGFNASPLSYRAIAVAPGLSAENGCVLGTWAGSACQFTQSANTPFPLPSLQGYYTIEVQTQDKAGNQSNKITRLALNDTTAPTIGPILAQGDTSVMLFASTAEDNLTLGEYDVSLGFGSLLLQRVPPAQLGSYGPSTSIATASLEADLAKMVALQHTDGSGAPTAGFTAVDSIRFRVFDLGGNQAVRSASVTYPRAGTAKTTFDTTWTLATTRQHANVCGGTGCSTPTSSIIGLDVSKTGSFEMPFERVDIYQVDGSYYHLLGSSPSPTVTDIAGVRTWTYSGLQARAGDAAPGTTLDFVAVGIDADGDAIMSQSVSVTVANP